MKKIYFKGYYGFKNLGDDTFTIVADWITQNYWKEFRAVFIGENLPKLSSNSKLFKVRNNIVRNILEVLISLKSTYIIYFGGSVFSKISGFKDIKFHYNYLYRNQSKVGTLGTSIGPFKTENDKNKIQNFLGKFKFISVRDNTSLELVKDMNLKSTPHFSFDPAILISEVYPNLKIKKKGRKEKKIAVSLCHYERYTGKSMEKEIEREEAILELLKKIIDKYQDEVSEVVFFILNGNKDVGDNEITEEFNDIISKKIKTKIVDYTTDTEQFCNEMIQCDVMIGTRLHSGILSYALDIPFIQIEYHPKCTEFLNTINHNYRFFNNDIDKSLENFDIVYNNQSIPEVIKPEYFKKIMIDEVIRLSKIL